MKTLINLALAALVAALISPPLIGAAADSLSNARDLYAAAAYEDALRMLERLESGEGGAGPEAASVAEVRAYCLLALGRSADASSAIAVVVSADPTYRPSGADASPRVRAAFSEVRRKMLPAIVQKQYGTAKAAFDAKEFAAARDGFAALLNALADPDLADAAAQPPLSDLRTLAGGFRDLAASAAVPPPIAARTQPIAVSAAALDSRIFTADDTRVTPPVVTRQSLPNFVMQGVAPRNGVLELLIDEHGDVEEAVLRAGVTPRYDQQLLSAAREWRYTPATLDGKPVRYRKLVQVTVQQSER